VLFYSRGSETDNLPSHDLKEGLRAALDKLGPKRKVLAVPPDFTRFHSQAGELTRYAWQYYGEHLSDILPAIGTHAPMTAEEKRKMFGETPLELFRDHRWRTDLVTLGEVPAEFVREVSKARWITPGPHR
jgi:nickel-dependent lactate racemase